MTTKKILYEKLGGWFDARDAGTLRGIVYQADEAALSAALVDANDLTLRAFLENVLVQSRGATPSKFDFNLEDQRRSTLMRLFSKHILKAAPRHSLTDDGSETAAPKQAQQQGEEVQYIGQSWGYIDRPEIATGMARFLISCFDNFKVTDTAPADMRQRAPYVAVFANWYGAGKTTALRRAVFDALQLLEEAPQQFPATQSGITSLLQLAERMRPSSDKPLALMYNFGAQGCCEPLFDAGFGLTPSSRLAWCFLYSLVRGSKEQGAPESLEHLLSQIPDHLDGQALDKQQLWARLTMNDVIACVRSCFVIPEGDKISILWAWDEARALPDDELQKLANVYISETSRRALVWMPLVIARTMSFSTRGSNRQPLQPLSARTSGLRNFQLIPMLPVELHSMLELVGNAWRYIQPNRPEGYTLHHSIRLWVALVEGNLRFLECLLAAASGTRSGCWNKVITLQLSSFLANGAVSEAQATRILQSLARNITQVTQVPHEVVHYALSGSQGGALLEALVCKCLLGDTVDAEHVITGTNLTYGMAQALGVCSLKPPRGGHDLQNADAQQGQVHMPAFIVHMLYEAFVKQGVFSHMQPLYQGWSNIMPGLLLQPRTKEYTDGAAIGLKVDMLRLQGSTTAHLSQLIPMEGLALEQFGGLVVDLPITLDLDPVTVSHKDLKAEAALPGPRLLIGQGTASEADALIKLALVDGGEIIIHLQSKFHRLYQTGNERMTDVIGELQKSMVPNLPGHRQLFVYCTDAQQVVQEQADLPSNLVIIAMQQHPAFYGEPGVLYRKLASEVLQGSARSRVDLAADLAAKDGTDESPKDSYKRAMMRLSTSDLEQHAQKRLKLDMDHNKTKEQVADAVIAALQ